MCKELRPDRLAAYVNTSSHRWQKRSHCLLTWLLHYATWPSFQWETNNQRSCLQKRGAGSHYDEEKMKGSQEWTWCSHIKRKIDGPCLCVCVCARVLDFTPLLYERSPFGVRLCDSSAIYSLVLPRLLFFLFQRSIGSPSVYLDVISFLRPALSSECEMGLHVPASLWGQKIW